MKYAILDVTAGSYTIMGIVGSQIVFCFARSGGGLSWSCIRGAASEGVASLTV